ncbi:MAG: DUF2784 domain-containing protein [Gemmatimonadetes bacterium]|nr:DUF2784 domain-containing protein [Gemmatimonadota bacterium]NNK61582.1 DUF2784 domain-containing protein [Gemmatimonadota bacterium]
MLHRLLADGLVLVHGLWLVFVVGGALLALRWPRIRWVHIPAVAWGALIEFQGWVCPLTPLENHLRRIGGEVGYTGGFIERYVTGFVYPAGLTREIQVGLGVGLLVLNVALYGWVWHRSRRRAAASAGG